MNKEQVLSIFRYLLVIGAGAVASWNISFFRPFAADYPPAAAYEVVSSVKGAPDSVVAAAGRQYGKSRFGEFWLGKHYRSVWATPVKVKVLQVAEEGLTLKKRGGGMQTTRFTLTDAGGNEYSLRSVDKDPISVIPSFLWPTVIGNFIRDQVSATDPFALEPVLALSEKAGIALGTARLVFVVRNDPAFKKFSLEKSGFYYLSPKNALPVPVQDEAPGASAVYSSEEMLQALEQQPEFGVDTTLYLKCRLFDLLIGDWDRHAGQWDWMSFPAENATFFKPIPKDRDQAFGFYEDGVLPFILSRDLAVRKITSFTPKYQDIAGFAENGSDLDSRFLRDVADEDVKKLVLELQQQLSDDVLEQALKKYPEPVYRQIGKSQFKTLQARREGLPAAAGAYIKLIRTRP